jgi:hypothetical protein
VSPRRAGGESGKRRQTDREPGGRDTTAIVPIAAESIDGYDAPDRPWSEVQACLDTDGTPHTMPLSAIWFDGAPFSAPSAGPQPWDLYRMTVKTVFGLGVEEPYSGPWDTN